jgi:glycosyltransferase involved in cell wall biosynthesis
LVAAASRFPVVAVELSSVDRTYAWDPVSAPELHRITVFQGEDPRELPRLLVARRIGQALAALRPRAVAVPGWSGLFALAALRWCRESGTPAVLMSDSQASDAPRYRVLEAVKRRLVAQCSAAFVGGARHVAYLAELGMPAGKVFQGYDVVDNDHFLRGAAEARANAPENRRRLGLPDRFFLASSRFIEKKNLLRLVEAFARFRALAPEIGWKLVLLGDGLLKPAILAAAASHSLGADLLLPGFIQYDQLPGYYGLASAFVHASTVEQWGLVVNEAMAAGLPVLVSNRCGCAADLVREEVNGFTFDPLQTETLAGLMVRIASDGAGRARMGEASRSLIAEWSPQRFAAGLEQAVCAAAAAPRPRLADAALLGLLLRRSSA